MIDSPGIYEGVTFPEYLAIEAISNSRLNQLNKSPLHYRENVQLDPSRTLSIGSLVHGVVIEPRELLQKYVVMPSFHLDSGNVTQSGKPTDSKATSYYKSKVKAFQETVGDREVVEQQWLDETLSIASSMLADDFARQVFTDVGPVEATIVWTDESGLLCKGRIDKVATTHGAMIDLKTTRDISRFRNAIVDYGYHRQLAHYSAGWEALTGEKLTPWIAAVETMRPYVAQCRPVSRLTMDVGERKRRQLISQLCDCMESNHWPGPVAPDQWELPEWAIEPVEISIGGETVTV